MTPLTVSNVSETPESRKRKIKTCEHARDRRLCKECGGSGICEHGKDRRLCKECGGSGVYLNMEKKEVEAKSAEEVYICVEEIHCIL